MIGGVGKEDEFVRGEEEEEEEEDGLDLDFRVGAGEWLRWRVGREGMKKEAVGLESGVGEDKSDWEEEGGESICAFGSRRTMEERGRIWLNTPG
jgi:hypothetical protein